MSITVTASTSVLLVDTQSNSTVVYMPNISSIGRLITIRDNTGFCTTNSSIILSTTAGASFAGPTVTGSQSNRLTINQPFGFLTLSMANNGQYNLINTFAFSGGQSAAIVSQLTTSNVLLDDLANTSFWPLYASNTNLYFISTPIGQVTNASLQSTVNGLGQVGYLSSLTPPVQNIMVTTGPTSTIVVYGNQNPTGTIQYSLNGGTNWYTANGGFYSGGNDVAYANNLFVACGDNNAGIGGFTTGHIQYSVDGQNWLNGSISLPWDAGRLRVRYNNGLWHCVGNDPNTGMSNAILWSSDGINWNPSMMIPFSNALAQGIAYGNGVWVVALGSTPSVPKSLLWSSDGSNWNDAFTVSWTQGYASDVDFDGIRFIAMVANGVSPSSSNLATSVDGKNWTSAGMTGGNFNPGASVFGYLANGVSSCVCGTTQQNTTRIVVPYPNSSAGFGQALKRSFDGGLTWQSNTSPSVNQSGQYKISRPYWDGNKWWAGYQFYPIASSNQGIYYSLDNGLTFKNTGITGGFSNGGYPTGFAATPGIQQDYGFQLQSTVFGLSQSFTTQQLTVSSILYTTGKVALGSGAGEVDQGNQAVAIGSQAGQISQQDSCIAIGPLAGLSSQSQYCIAIGGNAGGISQSTNSIAIGKFAGTGNQREYSIAIGRNAGYSSQSNYSIAIGNVAGETQQADKCIAIGNASASIYQSTNGIAIGNTAGYTGQRPYGIAVGTGAGFSSQSTSAIAIGSNAGYDGQGQCGVAIGKGTGTIKQGANAVAIGPNAGNSTQGIESIAIGDSAGQTNQGSYCVAIGVLAGNIGQSTNAIAIGNNAGYTGQRPYGIAIGNNAGYSNQSTSAIAIGSNAGYTGQGQYGVAIGVYAGFNAQGTQGIAIGCGAGNNVQGNYSVAIGFNAGNSSQKGGAIAIGYNAGQVSQSTVSIAIGSNAGQINQANGCIAIGLESAPFNQSTNAIAIGRQAGYTGQRPCGIAIGISAGFSSQSTSAIAIGSNAGYDGQGQYGVAIGKGTGTLNQGANTVAIGVNAGNTNQGSQSIAIGDSAGLTNQHANSIVLNASGTTLNTGATSTFHVSPIRNGGAGTAMNYNSGTGEVTYGTPSDSNMKEDIETARSYLDDLNQIRLVTYRWKDTDKTRSFLALQDTLKDAVQTESSIQYCYETVKDYGIYKYFESIEFISTVLHSTNQDALYNSILAEANTRFSTANKRYLGVLAQEVKEIFPSAVPVTSNGLYGVDPIFFTYLNTNAIQSMYSTQKALVSQVQSLTADVSTLHGLKA